MERKSKRKEIKTKKNKKKNFSLQLITLLDVRLWDLVSMVLFFSRTKTVVIGVVVEQNYF